MEENEFVSLGRPMKGAFIYIMVVVILTLIGVVCVNTKGSVLAIVLGIIFFIFYYSVQNKNASSLKTRGAFFIYTNFQ